MPRKAIDYSNTIIYKLCCNDTTITDIYVGHTTNWTKRKQCHKQKCNNENNTEYNFYVYQFIREHGGWTNWSMIELEKINCIDGNEACKHERRYFELLGATLNIKVPSRTQPEYSKKYREENADKERERRHKYYEENTDKIKKRYKKYCEENADKIKETDKKYYEENVDKIKETHKKYREENKDKINERQRKYYEEHKEHKKEYNKKYRELCKQRKLETEKLVDIIVDINV